MCKKINAEDINAMSIGADFIALNHDYNAYEVGKYRGATRTIEVDGKKLHFVGGILVEEAD